MNSLSVGNPGRPSAKRITSAGTYVKSPKFKDRTCIVSTDKIKQGPPRQKTTAHAEGGILRGLLPDQIRYGFGQIGVFNRGDTRHQLEPLVVQHLLSAVHGAEIAADGRTRVA